MTQVGHMVIGAGAEVVRVDAGLCAILRAPADALVGRGVLDLTVPEDRDACRAAMRTLVATGKPFQVNKRLLRADGTAVRVIKTVARSDLDAAAPHILGTVVPIGEVAGPDDPAGLLREARRQADERRRQAAAFGTSMFGAPAWSMMLQAYIREAEGAAPQLEDLIDAPCLSSANAIRWARALIDEGLLEALHNAEGTPIFRITAVAGGLMEEYLRASLRSQDSEPKRLV